MQIFYDLVFMFFSFLYLPYFILRRKYHREFIQRLGILSPSLLSKIKNKKIIWIHAVSVGEVNTTLPLWQLLREKFPQYRVVFSTITKTGNNLARKFAQPEEPVIYFPLDFSFIVRRFLNLIKPRLSVILETELWPNFISQCKKIGIPIFLVNARISDRAYRRYKLVKGLFKYTLNKIDLILAQTEKDARRIVNLGADENRVKITGNMKFDNIDCSDKSIDCSDKFRLLLGLGKHEKLLLAGSTHPGEEKVLLDVYKELLKSHPDLKLLIAPRHIERVPEIEQLVVKNGFAPVRISSLERKPLTADRKPIFLLDTIGQLKDFYAIADIVFVGGSLIKRGGHNIIEPAIFSKPIVSGKYFFNFSDIFRVFINNQALIICQDKERLKEVILDLLNNPEKADKLGQRAKAVIEKQRGADLKNLELIKNHLC